MFKCSSCGVSSLAGTKPVTVVVASKPRLYHFSKDGEPVVRTGSEIVHEARLCYACAGVEPPKRPTADSQASVALGLSLQKHAKLCNKKFEECRVCQKNIEHYLNLSAPTSNTVLSDVRVHTGRMSICALALDAMERRTKHRTKRAQADFLAAFPVIKAYEERGGTL